MRFFVTIVVAIALGSCAPNASPPGYALAQETAGRIAGPAQDCITTNNSQNLRALDKATLAYGWGPTIYINHLGADCPGLEPLSTIAIQPLTPGEYCRGDPLRGREAGASIGGPVCVLKDWVPYRKP